MGHAGSSGGGNPHGARRAAPSRLDILVGDGRGRPVRVAGLSSWLRRVAPAHVRGAIGLALVSDSRVRALNRTYRGVDHASDVLSFPAADDVSAMALGQGTPDRWLGEIVIARGVARQQARRAGHSELTELRVLALHGLLHLLGYDHERDAGEMGRLEQRLRRKGGLREGLIERAR